MSDTNQHQDAISECALAWQTLRMAHDRVAQRLGSELSSAYVLRYRSLAGPHERTQGGQPQARLHP